jgi:hypothetical protein
MNYQQAIEKSLTVEWEIGTCSQGEKCWCRTIKPVKPILFKDEDSQEEYHILVGGELNKEIVEHIVTLHNQNIKNQVKNG